MMEMSMCWGDVTIHIGGEVKRMMEVIYFSTIVASKLHEGTLGVSLLDY